MTLLQADGVVDAVVEEFVGGIVAAVPKLIAGAIFLAVAYIAIRLVLVVVRTALERVLPPEQGLVVDLAVLVAGIFLWFGAGLALLDIVGLGDIAASLGTATGFIALGISYALSNMIADTVAGVYLLRDPDFNEGDTVTADGVTGEVAGIGIRKSRLETENGDVVVLANRDVDKKWTHKGEATPAADEDS